jgi:hypothetical protein|tara:strand:+ start:269 stop:460 length:192 start_codon:yes stop_codon:yes gene_type:complete
MKTILGGFLVFAGMMAIAGSANDCDGKCMEFANSLEEMLVIVGIGLTMMVTGGIIIYNDNHGE